MFDERVLDEGMRGFSVEEAGQYDVPNAHRAFAIAAGRAWADRKAETGALALTCSGSWPHDAGPVLLTDAPGAGSTGLLRSIANQAARDRWLELLSKRAEQGARSRKTRAYLSSLTSRGGRR